MYGDKVFSNNIIYARSTVFRADNFKSEFAKSFENAKSFTSKNVGDYVINVPRGSTKHCYVWIDNSEIFHVLVGNNPDGSQRRRHELIEDSENSDDWGAGKLVFVKLESLVPQIACYELLRCEITIEFDSDGLICTNAPKGVTTDQVAKHMSRYCSNCKVNIFTSKSGKSCCKIEMPLNHSHYVYPMCRFVNIDDKLFVFSLSKKK